ncbi:hypothetical protein [Nesterenkonia pannonica]|uniref:hypothetical protein n=1 Tax=Nesterenkonia pannonica TaxID=1548602 RepID=UPI0021646D0C|nr:hypothetical protein [Nesterenkonia pannonica]
MPVARFPRTSATAGGPRGPGTSAQLRTRTTSSRPTRRTPGKLQAYHRPRLGHGHHRHHRPGLRALHPDRLAVLLAPWIVPGLIALVIIGLIVLFLQMPSKRSGSGNGAQL